MTPRQPCVSRHVEHRPETTSTAGHRTSGPWSRRSVCDQVAVGAPAPRVGASADRSQVRFGRGRNLGSDGRTIFVSLLLRSSPGRNHFFAKRYRNVTSQFVAFGRRLVGLPLRGAFVVSGVKSQPNLVSCRRRAKAGRSTASYRGGIGWPRFGSPTSHVHSGSFPPHTPLDPRFRRARTRSVTGQSACRTNLDLPSAGRTDQDPADSNTPERAGTVRRVRMASARLHPRTTLWSCDRTGPPPGGATTTQRQSQGLLRGLGAAIGLASTLCVSRWADSDGIASCRSLKSPETKVISMDGRLPGHLPATDGVESAKESVNTMDSLLADFTE